MTEKLASAESRNRWIARGGAAGAGAALLAAHEANKAYRKKSIFTRNISDIFKKRKALKVIGYKKALLGGAVAGAAGGTS